jgi:hypothetical protein
VGIAPAVLVEAPSLRRPGLPHDRCLGRRRGTTAWMQSSVATRVTSVGWGPQELNRWGPCRVGRRRCRSRYRRHRAPPRSLRTRLGLPCRRPNVAWSGSTSRAGSRCWECLPRMSSPSSTIRRRRGTGAAHPGARSAERVTAVPLADHNRATAGAPAQRGSRGRADPGGAAHRTPSPAGPVGERLGRDRAIQCSGDPRV